MPRKSVEPLKTIFLRIPEALWEWISLQAKADGLTKTAYVRRLCFQHQRDVQITHNSTQEEF